MLIKRHSILMFLSLLGFISLPVHAQIPADTTNLASLNNVGELWSIGTHIFGGVGFDQHLIGITTDEEEINISAGGGFGIMAIFAYNFNSLWEASINAGFQNSSLSKDVKNVEGDFSRTFFSASLKYRINVTENGYIKIGGGYGFYTPRDLDVDASEVAGGAHNIYEYDGNSGPHLSAEYEHIATNYTIGGGLRYVNVQYDMSSAKSNGISIPLSLLPSEVKKEFLEFNGSGIDFFFSISYLFN